MFKKIFTVVLFIGLSSSAFAKDKVIGLICDSNDTSNDRMNIDLTVSKDTATLYIRGSNALLGNAVLNTTTKELKALIENKIEDLDNKEVTDKKTKIKALFEVTGTDYKGRPAYLRITLTSSHGSTRFNYCQIRVSKPYSAY